MNKIFHLIPALLLSLALNAKERSTDCSLFWNSDKNTQLETLSFPQTTAYRKVGHHGPAVENSHMIVRVYMNGKGGIDIYSKTGKRGPELRQYKWYPTEKQRQNEGAGCDEYFVGKTVGLGGIWLWDGEKPVMPTPSGDMVAKVGKTDKGAWLEVIAYGVQYKGDKVDICIRVDTREGSRKARVTASELNGKKVQFLTGVNYPEGATVCNGKNWMAVWGTHPADVSKKPIEIGGGMWFKRSAFQSFENTSTQLQLISKPTSRISTEIISASVKEDELGTKDKFTNYVSRRRSV